MQKMTRVFLGIVVLLAAASPLWADLYTFKPNDPDLQDLPHQSWFMWGLKWSLPTSEVITGATLTYKNIWDWTRETDALYTHLLDSVEDSNGSSSPNYRPVGTGKQAYQRITVVGSDNQGGGDKFANTTTDHVLLGGEPWNDPAGGSARDFNLTYEIPTNYWGMLSDGAFGFGIDPDCHYFNDGIELTINTRTSPAVPAPTAGVLAAIGLGLLAWRLLVRARQA